MHRLFFFAMIFVLGAPLAAYPGTCNGQSPLTAYRKASVVFIGTVKKVDTRMRSIPFDGHSIQVGRDRTEFEVAEVFKGRLGKTASVTTYDLTSLSFSSKEFEVGKTYVVYAERRGFWFNEKLYAGACSRSGEIDAFTLREDVSFLRALPSPKGGIIRGRVWQATGEGNARSTVPLQFIRVKIAGPDGREIVIYSNPQGIYEVTGLPIGTYTVVPDTPDTYLPNATALTASVISGQISALDIQLSHR